MMAPDNQTDITIPEKLSDVIVSPKEVCMDGEDSQTGSVIGESDVPGIHTSPGGRAKPKHSSEILAKKEMLVAQTITFENAKSDDERLWQSQSKAYQAIYARMLNSKTTSADLAIYLINRCNRLGSLFADEFNTSFGEGELGSLRQAIISLELLVRNGQKQFVDAQSQVFLQSVKNATELASDLERRAAELRTAADKHRESIMNERDIMLASWDNYEQSMRESLLWESEGRSISLLKDPYLLARKYLHDLSVFRGGQANYSRAMKKIFEEVLLNDGRRINVLKGIIYDHLLAEKNIIINTLRLLDDSITAFKSIDRDSDVEMFLRTATELCADQQGKMVFDYQPTSEGDLLIVERLRSHVQHKGVLLRQGRIMKSNYKLGHAVLTLSGFLHFFDKREDETPVLHLQLKGASIKSSEETEPLSFRLGIPSHSFFSMASSEDYYLFKAGDLSSLKEWIEMIQDAIERATPIAST